MIRDFFAKFPMRYVGRVHGFTRIVRDGQPTGDEYHGWLVLRENGFGVRQAKLIVHPGYSDSWMSMYATRQKASVAVWLAGGPLPDLEDEPTQPKPKGELIVFPGGKGAA